MTSHALSEEERKEAFQSCLTTALWSSTVNDNDEPIDNGKSTSDFDETTREALRVDLEEFLSEEIDNVMAMMRRGFTIGIVAHDFWLTRNHHGVGFWDRGLGSLGEALTNSAHAYGSVDLYVGDDGKVYAL